MIANEFAIAPQKLEREPRRIESMFVVIGGFRPPLALRHDFGLRTVPRRAQGTMSQSLGITKMVAMQEELQQKQGTISVSSVGRL